MKEIRCLTEGADVIGRAAAASANDAGAGVEQRDDARHHLILRFVVDDFHVHEFWLPGVRLGHDRVSRDL